MNEKEQARFLARQRLVYISGLYWRIGFGLLILFGMLGNCTGRHEQAVVVFIITAVVWACLRMLVEGVESYVALRYLRKVEAAIREQEKNGPPPAPPPPPDEPPTAEV